MEHSSDMIVFWQYGLFHINLTIVETWHVILLLAATTSNWRKTLDIRHSHFERQSFLEIIADKHNKSRRPAYRSGKIHNFSRLPPLFVFDSHKSLSHLARLSS